PRHVRAPGRDPRVEHHGVPPLPADPVPRRGGGPLRVGLGLRPPHPRAAPRGRPVPGDPRRPLHDPASAPRRRARDARPPSTGDPDAPRRVLLDLWLTPEQLAFQRDVRDYLSGPEVREEVERYWGSPRRQEVHTDRVYQGLGERGWLAANWPREYGGLGQ